MPLISRNPTRQPKSVVFWILLLFLSLVLAAGGGARPDIQSLIFLRPLAVLATGFGLLMLTGRHLREYRFLLVFAAALVGLTGLHLIPLPAGIWSALPGRDMVVQADELAGIAGGWRPLSLIPTLSWNALYALFVPIAALLLAIQLKPRELHSLLPVLLCFGLASGMLGLLQVAGTERGPLYLYRISNFGSAVGFFANRNHQAVLLACLFPLLALFASRSADSVEKARLRAGLALAGGLVLIPLLLMTGSRAGAALGLIGLGSVPFLYRKPSIAGLRPTSRHWSIMVAAISGAGAALVGLATVLFGRAEAFRRMVDTETVDDDRFMVWSPIADMVQSYFPSGSGVGTFQEVYKIHEPEAVLDATYLNHAHNDWLEVLMTTGAPGLVLLAVATVAWAVRSARVWRTPRGEPGVDQARAASVVFLMLGLASIVDYPLRVPFIACFATIMAIWLTCPLPGRSANRASVSGGVSLRPPIDSANPV